MALTVGDAHLNFNGTCHGGVIFALADTAFGLASNSHGMIAAGIDAHITYHVAAQAGDTLTATATEVSRTRKLAVYRIDVDARRRHADRRASPAPSTSRRAPTSPRTARRDMSGVSPGRADRVVRREAWRGESSTLTCRCRTRGPVLRPR